MPKKVVIIQLERSAGHIPPREVHSADSAAVNCSAMPSIEITRANEQLVKSVEHVSVNNIYFQTIKLK